MKYVVALMACLTVTPVLAQCEGGVCKRPVRTAISQPVQAREGVIGVSRQVGQPARNVVRVCKTYKPVRKVVKNVAARNKSRVCKVVRVVTFPARVLFGR